VSGDEAARLYELPLPQLGALADRRRRLAKADAYDGRGNEIATYNIDRNINYTNVCVTRCKFCAFYRLPGDPEGYVLSQEEIFAKIDELRRAGGHQLLLQGGHHPSLKIDWFEALFTAIKARYPDIHLHALSCSEIAHIARRSRLSLAETLERLRAAGLDSIPGAGAEILDDRVRAEIAPYKESTESWLEVMREAHHQGLTTSATMMYGTVETDAEIVAHLRRLRELQDETGGFMTFIPLAFHPKNTEMNDLSRTTGIEDLKNIAVARLFLDNFPHIKAYWIMIGAKLAQVALSFGADDVDGTVSEEKITQMAGGDAGQFLARNELIRLIRDAGRIPVERDTLYNTIREYRD